MENNEKTINIDKRGKNPLTQSCRLWMQREGSGNLSIPGHTSFPLVKTFSVLLATDLF